MNHHPGSASFKQPRPYATIQVLDFIPATFGSHALEHYEYSAEREVDVIWWCATKQPWRIDGPFACKLRDFIESTLYAVPHRLLLLWGKHLFNRDTYKYTKVTSCRWHGFQCLTKFIIHPCAPVISVRAIRNNVGDIFSDHRHYSCDESCVDCIHLCQLEVSGAVRDDALFKKVILRIQIGHDVSAVHDDLNFVRCANRRNGV